LTLFDELETGSLGFFHAVSSFPRDLESEPERGFARLDGPIVDVDLLDENPLEGLASLAAGNEQPPEAIIGVLPDDAVMFLEVHGPFRSVRFGGAARASSKRYLARTVIGHVPVDSLRTTRLLSLQAHFHGIGRWAGMSASRESSKHDGSGRLKEWGVHLTGGNEQATRLAGARTLIVSTTWAVEGPTDRRTISAPVIIGCRSRRPTTVERLLQPLMRSQELLGLAFDGFVAAAGGIANLDVNRTDDDDRLDTTPSMWSGALMARPPSVSPPRSMDTIPLFTLRTLGGIQGLSRWIRLCETHPRATRSVTAPYREGRRSAAIALIEVAASFEYWVSANRPARWAEAARSSRRWAHGIAQRSGQSFMSWVGDSDAWAASFWRTYNLLKHEHTFDPDPLELSDLAESGRYLMMAVLLNRIAGSKGPSRAVFRHPRLHDLGYRLRSRFT
jgi:hypothetical protein